MKDPPAGHWMLGTYVDNPPGQQPRFTVSDVRSLTEAERDSFFIDRDLLIRTTAASTVLELARAFEAVRQDAELVIGSNGTQPTDRGQLRRDLDRFLSELTAFRNRVEKLADDHFGAAEAVALRKAFESGHRNQREYRLAWELRNTSLHGGDPMQGLNRRQELGESERWTYAIAEVLNGRLEDRGWRTVASMWEPVEEVSVVQLCAVAFSWSEVALGHFLTRNAPVIEAALERRAVLVSEAGDDQGSPVVFHVEWEGEGVARVLNTNIAFIAADQDEEARHAIAAAREVVSRWNEAERRRKKGTVA